MKKSVLISIRPQWVDLIARGEKTLEIRKTVPRLDPPFWCYIYCTRGNYKDVLATTSGKTLTDYRRHVIGGFVCDEIRHYSMPQSKDDGKVLQDFWQRALLKTSDLYEYSDGWKKDLYGLHISKFWLYDKTFGISPFNLDDFNGMNGQPITRAPQSWCYCDGYNDRAMGKLEEAARQEFRAIYLRIL